MSYNVLNERHLKLNLVVSFKIYAQHLAVYFLLDTVYALLVGFEINVFEMMI